METHTDHQAMQPALYKQMRSNILQTAFSSVSQSPFESDYLYAWYAGVYPCLSRRQGLHEPYGGFFNVKADQVNTVIQYLDELWRADVQVLFDDIEYYFSSCFEGSDWTRQSLINTCRYLYLTHYFDDDFWGMLVSSLPENDQARVVFEELHADELRLLGDLTQLN